LAGIGGNPTGGERRISVEEALSRSTYEALGWDFDTVWKMPNTPNGLPALRWQTGDFPALYSGGKVRDGINWKFIPYGETSDDGSNPGLLRIYLDSAHRFDTDSVFLTDGETGLAGPWFSAPYSLPLSDIREISIEGRASCRIHVVSLAFENYTNLLSVNAKRAHIGSDAFKNCSALHTVRLDNASVAENGFAGLTALSAVHTRILANESGQNVTFAEGAFNGCDLGRLTVHCYAESPARAFADAHGIKTAFYGDTAVPSIPFIYFYDSNLNRVEFNAAYFLSKTLFRDSSSFNKDLAKIALALSGAAYDESQIRNALNDLEFAGIQTYGYDEWAVDSVAHIIAHKKMLINGEILNLAVVVNRGTKGLDEWAGNVLGHVPAFKTAADKVYQNLTAYINDNGLDIDKTNVFITGHSRGAAVANLLGAGLRQKNVFAKEDVYVYTFATPNSEGKIGGNTTGPEYSNIFNVVNPVDVVTGVPPVFSYWKYGKTYAFPSEDKSAGKGIYESKYRAKLIQEYAKLTGGATLENAHPHETTVYLAWLNLSPLEFADETAGNYKIRALRIACPVDIEIYDSKNELIAGSADGATNGKYSGKVAVLIGGDEKYVQFYDDENYTVKFLGTDEGKMEYAIADVDMLTGETVTEKSFVDVALTSGKWMTSAVGGETDTPDVKLYVVENDKPVAEVREDGTETPVKEDNRQGGDNQQGGNSQQDGGGSATPAPAADKKTEQAPAPASWTNPFTDVKESDWFFGDVRHVCENGLFTGMSATRFDPNAPMTRAMLVTVLGRLHGADENAGAPSGFDDVAADKYYTAHVTWAKENGIVNGVGGNRFAPDAEITRQDLSVILARYAEFANKQLADTVQYAAFADEAAIADYAKNAVRTLYCGGIVNGRPGNRFDPAGKATRAEVAAMLHRFIVQSNG
jgi:hypothetical protein